jgi:hypothetical protein
VVPKSFKFSLLPTDFIFKRSKIASFCISVEIVEVAFFVTGREILQIQGVEMSTGTDVKIKNGKMAVQL